MFTEFLNKQDARLKTICGRPK